MIMQPEHIDERMLNEAIGKMRKKRPSPALDAVRLERYREGLSVQMMHVGPYATEAATVARMRAFCDEHGLVERHARIRRRGRLEVFDHHEIYLGDPRRAAPETLKTVLRQPVIRKHARAAGTGRTR